MARLLNSTPAVLVLIAVGLVLAAPLLQGETLCTDDGALHIYRTVALDRALRDGLLYPRWFPDLAYGYGFPFFVYREPLGYYALEALHLLGLSVPTAFNVTMAGGVVVAGIAMYLLGRDIFGPRGGLLAGVVYMTAPYVLIGPLVRGNLPEVIAFALMPLILFFFRRLIVYGQTRYFVASTASYAALFLTHNISSLLFTPVLLVYIAMLGWVQAANSRWLMADGRGLMADGRSPIADSPASTRDRSSIMSHLRYAIRDMRYAIRDTRYALLAVALTLGLTAFFWLPALAEQGEAQLYLTHSTRGNDYHFNFISVDELLGGPGSFDPNLLNPPLRISFGWVQLALAALGLLGYRRAQNREQRVTIIAAAFAGITFTLMALPITLPVWDRLPLIRFVQFPWRFVGRAMLPAALLAAAFLSPPRSINHKDTKAQSQLRVFAPSWLVVAVFGTAVFVALLFTAPLSYPRVCPTPHTLDINDVFAYERVSGHIGVDPLGAYLPVTVIERPSGSPLEAMYSAGRAIERFDASALPGGARVLDAQYGPNRADILVSTPTTFTATYLAFAFSGWNAQIDGRPIEIRPSNPNGLMTFDVPAGEHRIHVEFGDSPQRALADGISLIAVVAMIAAVVIHWRSRRSLIAYRLSLIAGGARHVSRFTFSILLALLVYVVVKSLLIDPGLTPLRAARLIGDTLSDIANSPDATFGDELRLLGYTVTPSTVRPGDRLRVDLYWKALKPLTANYQAEVGIADAEGWLWSPKHADRPRDYNSFPSMPEWPLDGYAVDSFEVEVLPGAPPGEYDLVVQVFDRETLAPLLPGTLSAPIGRIRVDRAARSFDADELRIYGGERHELDDDLTLLGYNIDRVEGVPGESVLLTFFWQADQRPQIDRSFRIELVDSSGNVLSSSVLPVGNESYRTSRWEAGEQVVSLAPLRVPAAAPSGEYHWRAVLLDDVGRPAYGVDMQPILRVAAPARTFDVPPIENRIDVGVGDFATLLGFHVPSDTFAPGDTIDLTLFWQPRAETSTSYKVFVHVLDEAGRIVAQADAMPLNGERPTTGWLPHEVIPDRHAIPLPDDLPRGLYRIQAGLYDVDGGVRLKTSEGADSIILTDIDVKQ